MKGRWSLYWIVFLFAALFLGPTLILEGPQSLKPSAGTLHAAMEQDQLRDAPNSPPPASPVQP